MNTRHDSWEEIRDQSDRTYWKKYRSKKGRALRIISKTAFAISVIGILIAGVLGGLDGYYTAAHNIFYIALAAFWISVWAIGTSWWSNP